jgi:hypothetical protein
MQSGEFSLRQAFDAFEHRKTPVGTGPAGAELMSSRDGTDRAPASLFRLIRSARVKQKPRSESSGVPSMEQYKAQGLDMLWDHAQFED